MMKTINYKGYEIDRDLLSCRFTVFSGDTKVGIFKTMKEAIDFINKEIENE